MPAAFFASQWTPRTLWNQDVQCPMGQFLLSLNGLGQEYEEGGAGRGRLPSSPPDTYMEAGGGQEEAGGEGRTPTTLLVSPHSLSMQGTPLLSCLLPYHLLISNYGASRVGRHAGGRGGRARCGST